MNEISEIATIERLVRSSTVHSVPGCEVPVAVIPQGYRLEDLENMQAAPRRIRESVKLLDVDSFIAYMNAWANENESVIFADENARTLSAVIDYHKDHENPKWGDHTAGYTAKFSRELAAWMQFNGKELQQIAFAEFLEDRVGDVVKPVGADLLERALKLQIITKGVFGSSARLATGEFSLQWSEEQEKGTVELPEKLMLGIPLFHNGKAYEIETRLRYRLNAGKVTFTYKLVNIEDAIEHAFAEIVAKVRSEVTEVSIFQGALA